MMKYIICFFVLIVCYNLAVRKYKNPYKLFMVFGKKGSGKSSFLIKQAFRYQKKGYTVYTNMSDCCVQDVRIIDADYLGEFVPCANSCLLLDEVGMLYDSRNYRNFKPAVRDFFKLQRHYKVVCFLASQSFDVDKKLRDLTDEMFLVSNVATVFSLIRPIRKSITLTDATSEGESRIAENLRFRSIFSWKCFYIPRFAKYFESFKVPDTPELKYETPQNPIMSIRKKKIKLRART